MKNLGTKKKGKGEKGKLFFYIALLAFPFLQFAIMYVAVNFKSIMMVFQRYVIQDGMGSFQFLEFENLGMNLVNAFKDLFGIGVSSDYAISWDMIKNSLTHYSFSLLIMMPLSLLFSFYIIKKFAGWKFFRLLLFIPAIISPIVLMNVFKIICDGIIPEMLGKINNVTSDDLEYLSFRFMSHPSKTIPTLLCYSLITGFASNVLLYSGAMSGVSVELFDAAQIDGANDFQEFGYIVFPAVWGTFSTFIVVGIANFFVTDYGLFSVFGQYADKTIRNIGYYLYINALSGTMSMDGYMRYPYMAALGVVFTCIAMPLVFGVRYLLRRFGPSEE